MQQDGMQQAVCSAAENHRRRAIQQDQRGSGVLPHDVCEAQTVEDLGRPCLC